MNPVPGVPAPPGPGNGLWVTAAAGYVQKLMDECSETIDGAQRSGGIINFNDGGAELRLIRFPG